MLLVICGIVIMIMFFSMAYHMVVAQERWDYTLRTLRAAQRNSQYHHRNEEQPSETTKPPTTKCPGNKCANKERDNMYFLIMMMLGSQFKNNPNVANGRCISKIMSQSVPKISQQLRLKGIDINKVNYDDPRVKAVVNNIVNQEISSGACGGMRVPPSPAICPKPEVIVRRPTPRVYK
jgi:hypothetical protein